MKEFDQFLAAELKQWHGAANVLPDSPLKPAYVSSISSLTQAINLLERLGEDVASASKTLRSESTSLAEEARQSLAQIKELKDTEAKHKLALEQL